MKKLKMIMLSLFLLLVSPVGVFADVSAPDYIVYDAVVSNENGAKLYDYNLKPAKETISKGTKVQVDYEYIIKGVYYSGITYNGERYYVKSSDLGSDISWDKEQMEDGEEVKYLAYKETPIYANPSKGQKVIATIPANEIVTVRVTHSYNWGYIEYNGVKGWVFCIDGYTTMYDEELSTLAKANTNNVKLLIISDKVIAREQPIASGKKINTNLKHGDTIDYIAKYDQIFGEFYYVEINGVKEWISQKDVAEEYQEYFIIYNSKQANIYNNPHGKAVNNVLEENILYKSDYCYSEHEGEWYGIRVGENIYWINDDGSEDGFVVSRELERVKLNEKLKYYKSIYEDSKGMIYPGEYNAIKGIFLYDEDVPSIREEYYYIEGFGYINVTNVDIEDIAPVVDEKTTLTPLNYVYLCVAWAVIISITTLVIVRLIKSNKERKEEESKKNKKKSNKKSQ